MDIEIQKLLHGFQAIFEGTLFFKDVLMPIFLAMLGAILGGLVAYLTYHNQEWFRNEKDKVDLANQLALEAKNALQTMIGIKANYFARLSDNPVQRAVSVQSVLFYANPISFNLARMAFLAPRSKDSLEPVKWSQIPYIQTLLNNYNHVLQTWEKRNNIDGPIRDQIFGESYGVAYKDLSCAEIMNTLNGKDLAKWIDLTEHLISMTDDLIIAFDEFVYEFPDFASSKLNMKGLRGRAVLLKFSPTNDKSLLQKCIAPDLDLMAEIMGRPSDDLKKKYHNGYD